MRLQRFCIRSSLFPNRTPWRRRRKVILKQGLARRAICARSEQRWQFMLFGSAASMEHLGIAAGKILLHVTRSTVGLSSVTVSGPLPPSWEVIEC